MKACKVSIMASREKARSTACEPLEIEVKSHKVIRQSSVKTLNKCTKIGKLEKEDWTAFSYARKSHSPRSPRQPHHRLPGTRARRPTRCHQKWHCSYLPNPHWWQRGAASLFGTTVHVLFSSAVHCQDLLPSSPFACQLRIWHEFKDWPRLLVHHPP